MKGFMFQNDAWVVASGMLIAASTAQAAVYSQTALTTDRQAVKNPSNLSISDPASVARVGEGTTGYGNGSNYFVAFALPTLGDGETISSISLTVNATATYSSPSAALHADLYVLGTGNTATIPNLTDTVNYIEAETGSGTKVGNDVLVIPANQINSPTSYTTSLPLLVTYLESLYAGGSTPSQAYIYLRLNHDTNGFNNNRGWDITTAGVEGGTANADAPVLIFTTEAVPEAGTLALMVAGGVMLLRRYRV